MHHKWHDASSLSTVTGNTGSTPFLASKLMNACEHARCQGALVGEREAHEHAGTKRRMCQRGQQADKHLTNTPDDKPPPSPGVRDTACTIRVPCGGGQPRQSTPTSQGSEQAPARGRDRSALTMTGAPQGCAPPHTSPRSSLFQKRATSETEDISKQKPRRRPEVAVEDRAREARAPSPACDRHIAHD